MNDKDTKQLLDKSIVEASDDFTDKLMQRLEAKKIDKKVSVWRFTLIFSALVILLFVISYASYKLLKSDALPFYISIENVKTPIFLMVTALLFLSLNYILKLNEAFNISKSDK